MNIKTGDYPGLLYEINVATDHDFTASQSQRLIEEFKKIPWKDAYRITANFIRNSSIPKNIYGTLLSIIDQESDQYVKKMLKNEEWIPVSEEYASPDEFTATLRIISLISTMKNSFDILTRFGESMQRAIDKGNLTDFLNRSFDFYTEKSKDRNNLKEVLVLE